GSALPWNVTVPDSGCLCSALPHPDRPSKPNPSNTQVHPIVIRMAHLRSIVANDFLPLRCAQGSPEGRVDGIAGKTHRTVAQRHVDPTAVPTASAEHVGAGAEGARRVGWGGVAPAAVAPREVRRRIVGPQRGDKARAGPPPGQPAQVVPLA